MSCIAQTWNLPAISSSTATSSAQPPLVSADCAASLAESTAMAGAGGQAAPPTTDGAALFSAQAGDYCRFRPRYPQAVFDLILSHLEEDQRQLAVDVATGNGQAALALAQHFQQVLATDGNEEQLRHAAPAPSNVRFQHSDAHTIALPDGSVDLITAASSLHWFDLPRFYRECRRVLAPHGCLAAWAIPLGSATLEVPAAPAAAPGCQAALHWLHEDTLGELWDARKRLCDALYEEVAPSLHDFSLVLSRQLSMAVELSVEALVGYAASWSAYASYRTRWPQRPDPLLEYRQRLSAALEDQGLRAGDALIVAHIPIIMIVAQHPKPLS